MDASQGLSTGPKTPQGKAISAKNAQTHAIFTEGYLPWEDINTRQENFKKMCQHWGADDPLRLMVLRSIEQASLMADRLALVQRQRIEGLMQSSCIKRLFAIEAGFTAHNAEELPMWFFLEEEDGDNKKYALYLARVQAQAAQLKNQYCDVVVPQIEARFADLYHYVMQGKSEKTSFLMVLGQRFKQSVPTLNLAVVINQISERYGYHVDWAVSPLRYQTIIHSLRAEQMLVAMDLEKSTRYATTFQNRMIKGIQALAALDLHEKHMRALECAQQTVIDSNPVVLANQPQVQQSAKNSKAGGTVM